MTRLRWAILLIGILVLGGLGWGFSILRHPHESPSAPAEFWFEDVTDQVGLDFTHDPGPVGGYLMPQHVGSGVALFDFDNDGLLDILLLQNGGPNSPSTNRLFRQLPGGKFQDVSKGSGLDINGHNMGVAVGDVNNDGFLDVLITQYNGIKLFLNNGDGTFRDATQEAGLDFPSWGASAAFFDYDRDGWLDLVVVSYVDYDPTHPCKAATGLPEYCGPSAFKGRVSRLFHNVTGKSGARGQSIKLQAQPDRTGPDEPGSKAGATARSVTFEDATVKSGLGSLAGPGLGVLCADFDGDGWPDIFIANDGAANRLWINQHDGTFRDEALQRGIAYNMFGQPQANMGIAYGDVHGEGLMDIFVTHLADETHTLWKQGPRGSYTDRSSQSGVLRSHWRGTGFGTLLGDFTNAGRLDLALVNGSIRAQASPGDAALGPFWRRYGQRNQLFAGDGRGNFRDVSLDNAPFCGTDNVARGLAQGDFDRDGGLDLVVTTIGGKARLFRNVAKNRGHWLSIRAIDPALKRDAIGATVRVLAGERSWVRWLHPTESYLSSSEPRAHFGIGSFTAVDRIEITWPDGKREIFPGCAADRRIELRKGDGQRANP